MRSAIAQEKRERVPDRCMQAFGSKQLDLSHAPDTYRNFADARDLRTLSDSFGAVLPSVKATVDFAANCAESFAVHQY